MSLDLTKAKWEEATGKLPELKCIVGNRRCGSVIRSRKAALGVGWASTLCDGFFATAEEAKDAHLNALARTIAEQRIEPGKCNVPARQMTGEEYCRLRGIVFMPSTSSRDSAQRNRSR